ncbi:hypothetical protein J6590_023679 [Homalodisca vitripennis]|nr:hypothetical protein J6590_023679 [Homalodisca vitripennis]
MAAPVCSGPLHFCDSPATAPDRRPLMTDLLNYMIPLQIYWAQSAHRMPRWPPTSLAGVGVRPRRRTRIPQRDLDAQLVYRMYLPLRGRRVVLMEMSRLRRRCPAHATFEALVNLAGRRHGGLNTGRVGEGSIGSNGTSRLESRAVIVNGSKIPFKALRSKNGLREKKSMSLTSPCGPARTAFREQQAPSAASDFRLLSTPGHPSPRSPTPGEIFIFDPGGRESVNVACSDTGEVSSTTPAAPMAPAEARAMPLTFPDFGPAAAELGLVLVRVPPPPPVPTHKSLSA